MLTEDQKRRMQINGTPVETRDNSRAIQDMTAELAALVAKMESGNGERVLFVDDNVRHVSNGKTGVVQRIVYWHRVSKSGKDFSYFRVYAECADGSEVDDTADKFMIHMADFPYSDMEIPI